MKNSAFIKKLNEQFKDSPANEILKYVINKFKNEICFASSFGAEDQVITEMIASIDKTTEIFTLDTGRLFQETYDLYDRTRSRYKINIKIIFPDNEKVEEMVNNYGANLFYKSIENRKICCHTRKIAPLKKAIQGKKFWITGLRNEQSNTRVDNKLFEYDDINNLIKINPLINWSEKDVWDYIKEKDIPYNLLHDKGFNSIGCLPCTRAIKQGENNRAGRWWWENQDKKECGLHLKF